tara:strand:+ start:2919 stop:3296 length:378 start_codon:yes stop_codon:yes gene_type:complete
MEELPLLTMTKSHLADVQPELTSESENLLSTLSGLCSFHSSQDLASFLFTDQFNKLIGTGDSWITFEVGIYKDHTITVELKPIHGSITIADEAMSGCIPNNVIIAKTETECSTIIQNWYDCVMTA